MLMKNKEYWEKRMDNALKLSAKQIQKPLKKLYQKSFNNIKNELLDIWLDMQNDEGISQSALYQKNRMANLQGLLSKELQKLGAKNIELLQLGLYHVGVQGFQDMSNYLGVSGTFSFLDEQVAKEIITQNYKGASFSERIWNDMDKLRQQIGDGVAKAALQGKDVRKVAWEIQDRMNVSFSSAKRIAVTETGRVFNESCRKKAIDNGYKTYSVLVESDACEDCVDAFSGKHFDINESVLPLHPHCKCCMIIDID